MEIKESAPHGSVLGAILLIAGCCIGAGMLGLPVLTAMAGFYPSAALFFVSWLFMTATGLLLLEVNLWFQDEVGVTSMAQRTLGGVGKITASVAYLLLFYCLMVAYVSGSGNLAVDLAQATLGMQILPWVGSLIFTGFLGVILMIGTRAADYFNRLLMAGLLLTYVGLVFLGSPHIDTTLLCHRDWSMTSFVLPMMIVSFGYHNLVPSLTTYLNRDRRRLKRALIVGGLVPLGVYLIWEYLILGIVPVEGEHGLQQMLGEGQMATYALKFVVGSSRIIDLAQGFAFFALITSFVAVALSFIDFLADLIQIEGKPLPRLPACVLALLPPLLLAFFYPSLFLVALNYAGGVFAVILFGVLPAAMVWVGRYHKKLGGVEIVPGGRLTLLLIMLFSAAVLLLQLTSKEGL
jgi:tyrosine-specific transport protein